MYQYNGGDKVVFGGHLWTAKWWSYGDTPGGTYPLIVLCSRVDFDTYILGAAGDWTDNGACTTKALAAGAYVTMKYESKSVPLKVPVETPAGLGPKGKQSRVYRF